MVVGPRERFESGDDHGHRAEQQRALHDQIVHEADDRNRTLLEAPVLVATLVAKPGYGAGAVGFFSDIQTEFGLEEAAERLLRAVADGLPESVKLARELV